VPGDQGGCGSLTALGSELGEGLLRPSWATVRSSRPSVEEVEVGLGVEVAAVARVVDDVDEVGMGAQEVARAVVAVGARGRGCARSGRGPAVASGTTAAVQREAVARSGRWAARRRATSSGQTPGWSTCATTTREGERSSAAATPTRSDDAMPDSQAGLSTTRT